MKTFILMGLLAISLYGRTTVSQDVLNPGQRGDGLYRVWVFFDSKDLTEAAVAQPAAMNRRQKRGISADPLWFDIPVAPRFVDAIEKTGADVLTQSRWLNAVSVLATGPQLERVAEFPFVSKLKPVAQFKQAPLVPSDSVPGLSNARTDTAFYGYSWDEISQIQCDLAHEAGFTGQGIRILVMDTGFNLAHTAFDSLNLIAQWDVINNDSVCANETANESAAGQDHHGTMVLSAMAGYAPNSLIGPAYSAEFILAKTEIVTEEIIAEEDNYVAGLEWGESLGADVVSTSLGYLDWYSYCDMDGNTAITTNAIDIAAGLGVICVTAMGNQGFGPIPADTCNDPLDYYMIAPADADSVFSIGAVTATGTIAGFSSHGPTYDGRTKPEFCTQGVATACVTPNTVDGYTHANGTSLATPLASGAIAVLLSAHPTWTFGTIREAVLATATQSAAPDNSYGWGILQIWDAIQYQSSSVGSANPTLPVRYDLAAVFPNPFNSRVTINVKAPAQAQITLAIYDIRGNLVERLLDRVPATPGMQVTWIADRPASGVYIAALTWNDGAVCRKLTLLK